MDNLEDDEQQLKRCQSNAQKAFNVGKYDEAIRAYKLGLKIYPNDELCLQGLQSSRVQILDSLVLERNHDVNANAENKCLSKRENIHMTEEKKSVPSFISSCAKSQNEGSQEMMIPANKKKEDTPQQLKSSSMVLENAMKRFGFLAAKRTLEEVFKVKGVTVAFVLLALGLLAQCQLHMYKVMTLGLTLGFCFGSFHYVIQINVHTQYLFQSMDKIKSVLFLPSLLYSIPICLDIFG